MHIFKFGGASVKNADAVKNVSKILGLFPKEQLLIVISAMGKTTNAMEEIVTALQTQNKSAFQSKIEESYQFHLQIANDLFEDKHFAIYQKIEHVFDGLIARFDQPLAENKDFEYDQIVSLGEVLSTLIVEAFLKEQGHATFWIDARKVIRTNHQYREGEVNWERTQDLFNEHVLPEFKLKRIGITQGFIGHTSEGFTTTLGREGSDFTAGILAYCANATSVTIWKDVPGMLNADPRFFDDTIKLNKISFKEAIELSYYGASVIHPKTVKPLQNKNIPLYVKSFLDPEADGTMIQESQVFDNLIPSFICKMNQVLMSFTPKDFSFIAEENLSEIFKKLAKIGVRINLMQNSALSFSIVFDASKSEPMEIVRIFSEEYTVKFNEGLELVTIRHYDEKTIERVTKDTESLLEQRTRQTIRMVLKKLK